MRELPDAEDIDVLFIGRLSAFVRRAPRTRSRMTGAKLLPSGHGRRLRRAPRRRSAALIDERLVPPPGSPVASPRGARRLRPCRRRRLRRTRPRGRCRLRRRVASPASMRQMDPVTSRKPAPSAAQHERTAVAAPASRSTPSMQIAADPRRRGARSALRSRPSSSSSSPRQRSSASPFKRPPSRSRPRRRRRSRRSCSAELARGARSSRSSTKTTRGTGRTTPRGLPASRASSSGAPARLSPSEHRRPDRAPGRSTGAGTNVGGAAPNARYRRGVPLLSAEVRRGGVHAAPGTTSSVSGTTGTGDPTRALARDQRRPPTQAPQPCASRGGAARAPTAFPRPRLARVWPRTTAPRRRRLRWTCPTRAPSSRTRGRTRCTPIRPPAPSRCRRRPRRLRFSCPCSARETPRAPSGARSRPAPRARWPSTRLRMPCAAFFCAREIS